MRKIYLAVILFLLGSVVFATTSEDIFGKIPEYPLLKPVPLKDNFFIIGSGGQNGIYGIESARLLKKYGGNVVWNGHIENFSDISFFENMKSEGIPTLAQTWGMGFTEYLRERDALEYTWGDLNLNRDIINSNSHLLSMSHPATVDLWKEFIKCAVYSGSNGYVFCDQVSPWFPGRGSQGCNPVTIAAFRIDLEGKDEGILCNINGKNQTVKFSDYAKYYLGFVLQPSSLGLKSWDDYYPTRKAVYDPEGYKSYIIDGQQPGEFYFNVDSETKQDYIPEFLLRDMLIHYEYLKFCDTLGKQASSLGGVYYPMPNSEDMANGVDLYFLSSLVNVQGNLEEYFQCPLYNDVTYTRIDYLTKNIQNIPNKRFGVVLESGGGGNACPYYDHYVDYIVAYEATLANRANMLEGDFWPNLHAHLSKDTPLDEYKKDVYMAERMKAILSYANGFKYADKDKGTKLKPDFTTVVSRRIFRPWGKDYKTYTYFWGDPNKDIQPDEVLYNSGYVFNTVGFEDAENLSGEMVVWSANTPTVEKFDTFLQRVKKGYVVTGLMVAEALDTVLDNNLKIANLSDYFPEYTRELVKPNDDNLIKISCRGKEYTIDGNYYKMPQCKVALSSDDGIPLLYSLKIDKSDMYIVPFNPALKDNAEIAKFVYNIVLDRSSIFPHWESVNNSKVALYKTKNGWTARLRSNYMDANWENIYKNEDVLKQRCDYVIGESTEAKIILEPNKDYFVYNLFDGEEEKITSDAKGKITIKSNDKSMSLFFIREIQDTELVNKINARRAEYEELLQIK